MNNAMTWIGIAIVAVAASVGTNALFSNPSPADASGDAGTAERIDRLEQRLVALDQRIETLAAANATPNVRVSETAIQEAVERAIGSRPPVTAAAAGDDDAGAPTDAAQEPELDDAALQALLAELRAGDLDFDEAQKYWSRIAAAGRLDDAIDMFEEMVELDPNNPDLHADLGAAYIQKVNSVSDMEKGIWAFKADQAYDQALQIDSGHWDARFSKAVSLSFWPPIMGKQPAAIQHFETLLDQQEQKGDLSPKYEQTYVFLGNLYQQAGKIDQAKAIWQKGLAKFPQSDWLKSSIGE